MRKILMFLFMLLTITCYGQANGDEFIFSPYVKSYIANYETSESIKDIKKYTKQHEEVNVCFNGDEINIALSAVNDDNKKETEIVSNMHFNLKEAEISFFISKEDTTIQRIKITDCYVTFLMMMDEKQETIMMADKSKNEIYVMEYKGLVVDRFLQGLFGGGDKPEPKDFEKNFKLISNKLSRYNVKSGFLE